MLNDTAQSTQDATSPEPHWSVLVEARRGELLRAGSEPIRQQIADHFWWHSIHVRDGIVTPGRKSPEMMRQESDLYFGPLNLEGRTVLDVGTWNGGFSIEAARRGARHVLATDSYCWQHPDLRGRETFELIVPETGLPVEGREIDANEITKNSVGAFDVTLFLGVFYHLIDPIAVTRQLADLTREVLVMETHIDAVGETRPMMVMYPTTELNDDATNWWGPNPACVRELLKLFGFSRIEETITYDGTRAVFHAWK